MFCITAIYYIIPAVPSSGLYFTLNGTVYLSGDTVLISDIGVDGISAGVIAEARTSLVCQTINLNIICCRGSDGNRAGDWYFPGGGMVPGNNGNEGLDFTRSGYTQQVRLNRRNGALTPTGVFECRSST